eukprot:NODE_82_length_22625_cov_0.476516.p17 type:complete len:107 gc:universal NODE_82_length_22625_cov_0.476516:11810-12130(+)
MEIIVVPLYEEYFKCLEGKRENLVLKHLDGNMDDWINKTKTRSNKELKSNIPDIRVDTDHALRRLSSLTPNSTISENMPKRVRSKSTRDFSKILFTPEGKRESIVE